MLVSCTHVCTDIFIMEIRLNIHDSIHFLKFILIRYVKSRIELHSSSHVYAPQNYIIKYALC